VAFIAEKVTGELEELPGEKNPHAVALARLASLKGSKIRAERLTEAKRREIAKKAARARWEN